MFIPCHFFAFSKFSLWWCHKCNDGLQAFLVFWGVFLTHQDSFIKLIRGGEKGAQTPPSWNVTTSPNYMVYPPGFFRKSFDNALEFWKFCCRPYQPKNAAINSCKQRFERVKQRQVYAAMGTHTKNDFWCSVMPRGYDRAVMFLIKCGTSKIHHLYMGVLHSPLITLLYIKASTFKTTRFPTGHEMHEQTLHCTYKKQMT